MVEAPKNPKEVKELLLNAFDCYLKILDGFIEMIDGFAGLKRLEEDHGIKLLQKKTVEDVLDLLSHEEMLKILSEKPEELGIVLKALGRIIKIGAILENIDIDRMSASNLYKILEDLKILSEDFKKLREAIGEVSPND